MVKSKKSPESNLDSADAEVIKELEEILGTRIPAETFEFGYCSNDKRVTSLYLGESEMEEIPEIVCNLTSLQTLDVYDNRITYLPKNFSNLTELEDLSLSGNTLGEFPEVIFSFNKIKYLYLIKTGIENLPDKFNLISNLVVLNLSDNHIRFIPESFSHLHELKNLFLDENELSSPPTAILNLSKLEWLTLSDNQMRDEFMKDLETRREVENFFKELIFCESCGQIGRKNEKYCSDCGSKI